MVGVWMPPVMAQLMMILSSDLAAMPCPVSLPNSA
jgi:hypothetical protein